jgi:hypothetical protein
MTIHVAYAFGRQIGLGLPQCSRPFQRFSDRETFRITSPRRGTLRETTSKFVSRAASVTTINWMPWTIRPGDGRHTPGQCPLRNIWFLQIRSRISSDNIHLVASTDTSMSKMEIHYLWITSASGPATCLYRENTHEDIAGYLATLPYRHNLLQDGWEKCTSGKLENT